MGRGRLVRRCTTAGRDPRRTLGISQPELVFGDLGLPAGEEGELSRESREFFRRDGGPAFVERDELLEGGGFCGGEGSVGGAESLARGGEFLGGDGAAESGGGFLPLSEGVFRTLERGPEIEKMAAVFRQSPLARDDVGKGEGEQMPQAQCGLGEHAVGLLEFGESRVVALGRIGMEPRGEVEVGLL